jgi:hypothetical protein
MKRTIPVCLFVILMGLTISCDQPKSSSETTQTPPPATAVEPPPVYAGNYVSNDYLTRHEGNDWVVVMVTQPSDSTLRISVRSRSDKKKPTCTFDANAVAVSRNQYQSVVEGKTIVYTFGGDSILISTANEADKNILQFFCSGGGSLGGTYKKMNEALDKSKLDQRVFIKTLMLNNIGFEVSTTGEGSMQQLTVQPFGLKVDNAKTTLEIDGSVTGAEIGDLNRDGYPELFIYTQSAGSGSYGKVIGFSVNAGKSVSQIAIPDVADIPKANEGYMGHDEFALVEGSLVQRFKTYQTTDNNSNPTGKTRQIQYKLKDGEASRKLVVDQILEY